MIHTAYAKFNYARKAISLNVFDYILKPIDNEELFETLFHCMEESIRRKKRITQQKSMESMVYHVKQYALSLLASNTLDNSQIMQFFDTIGWPEEKDLQTCVLHFYSKTPFFTEELKLFAQRQEWLKNQGFLSHMDYIDSCSMLMLIQPQTKLDNNRWYTLVRILVWAMIQKTANISVKMGDICETIPDIVEECKNQMQVTERIAQNAWERVQYPVRHWRRIRKKEGEKYKSTFERYLRNQQYQKLQYQVKKILASYEEDKQEIFWEVVLLLAEAVADIWDSIESWDIWQSLFDTHVEEEKWIEQFHGKIRQFPPPDTGDAFESLLLWMQEAFADEVTLTAAAERIGMDASYFSRFFKKKTGKNFSDYLTDIRIKHAEKCLKEKPDITLEELCAACGFSSKTYFSEVFKKWKGITITQYLKIQRQ